MPELQPEELQLCDALEKAADIKGIEEILSSTENTVESIDNYICSKQPPRTLIGITIEKAAQNWPQNKEQVVELLKKEIEKGADIVRTLAIESKGKSPREHLKILLEIIFSESIHVSDATASENNFADAKKIAERAASDTHFLWAIDGLQVYCRHKNSMQPITNDLYKNLEIKAKELQLNRIQADPYFRSLKWFLETSGLFANDFDSLTERSFKRVKISKNDGDYEIIPSVEEMNVTGDDVFLGTLELVSDIRDEICATDSYLKKEYQKLSDQAEEFAVALIDEVQNERELSTVIKMEDKFSEGANDVFEDRLPWMRRGIEKVSLIQHAINLRCKSFVVNKNCQHMLKEVIFGKSMRYRFWNDPRTKTGTGMPPFLVLLLKVFLSLFCGAFMTLLIPFCFVLSLVNLCDKSKRFDGFFEIYQRPCQKFLFELWWFMVFLGLVIYTSTEENFSQKGLHSGLTVPDIFLFVFVVMFWLRLVMIVFLRLQFLYAMPRYRRNWRLIFPDILTVVECASLMCFAIAFIWWMIRWNDLGRWLPSDKGFQQADICYSLGSLLCFFKLAHFLKAHHTLGTLNLSLYMMFTKDVIYFAIIFGALLFVPFGTGLRKLYSYYVVDKMKNATHPFARYGRTYEDLFWTMLGSDEVKDSEITDSNYYYVHRLGEAFIGVFAFSAVVVAFNMLIATMNHTYEEIMQNVDKEYVFSRTRMWIEYIAMDHPVLPPPLNLADITTFCKCSIRPSGDQSPEEDVQRKRKQRISIIKQLVFRYLKRSLGLESAEDPGVERQDPNPIVV